MGIYDKTEPQRKPDGMTNNQRTKDREMQRAYDLGVADRVAFLPTRSRMRRAHTTLQKKLNGGKQNADSLPMPDAQTSA